MDIDAVYKAYESKEWPVVARLVEECYNDQDGYLSEMGRIWNQNIHFWEGDQHIRYSETSRQFEPIPTTKYNEFIPRPITNIINPVVGTLTSLMTRQKPQASVQENSSQDEDINKAKLGDMVLDAKWEDDDEQKLNVTAAKIALIIGTVYRKDYWDTTGLAKVEVEGKELPLGDNAVEMLTPFEVIPDRTVTDINSGCWVLEARVHPVDRVKAMYSEKGEGFTGLAEKVKSSDSLSTLLSYSERLLGSTGQGGQSGERPRRENACVLIEMYLRPTKKHPKGVTIAVADGKTLFAGDTQYTYGNGKNWHPYNEYKWELHPFRVHGVSLVEQLVPLQKRLNAVDALIILNRMTMATPQWLIPKGANIPGGYISGKPGLNITYTPGLGGVGPTKVPGVALDSSVYMERQKCIEEIHMIAGDNEVMSGLRPEGVNTAAGLQILLEQSYSKYSPTIQMWEKFIEQGQLKKLNLIQRKYKEPRESLVNRMRAMNKDTYSVEVDDFFTGEMLGDNINVRVEAGSSLPRSKVVEQSQLQELAQAGMLGPITPDQDPVANREFLRKFGITKFPTIGNVDVDRQVWENSMIRQKKFDQVAVLEFDNHDAHIKVIDDEIKKPEFFQRNDEEQIVGYFKHRYEHQAMMGGLQAAQMTEGTQKVMDDQNMAMQELGAGPPPPPPPQMPGMPGEPGMPGMPGGMEGMGLPGMPGGAAPFPAPEGVAGGIQPPPPPAPGAGMRI